MKKTLLVGLFSVVALGAFAQGTVIFGDRFGTTWIQHIYAPQTDNPGQQLGGAGALDTPSGGTVYNGGFIGGASGAAGLPINYTFGNNFDVQLAAAAGSGFAFSSLTPVSQYFEGTVRTTASAPGNFQTVNPANDTGIPGATAALGATIAIEAWYNAGGTITSYAAAVAANVPYGNSPTVFIPGSNLGGLGSPPNVSTPQDILVPAFNLTTVPEPSTIALGVMGACAFLARRRKR